MASTGHRFTTTMGGNELIIETGKLAQQAGGAVTVRMGDTMLFCSATMATTAREGTSFFPLSVDYEEKLYAGGRIPGSFFRREGRPSESAILVARVIDRTLRPLFPEGMRNDVQIYLMSLSHDQEHQVDMLGIIAASAALAISDIPWDGPVAGVRIGLIDGKLVVNPTFSEMENSSLDLRVSGTEAAINMVECGADEVDEQTMISALGIAREAILPVLKLLREMREAVGKPKAEFIATEVNEAVLAEVHDKVRDDIRQIVINNTDRHVISDLLNDLRERVVAEYEARNVELLEDQQVSLSDVAESIEHTLKEIVRNRILDEKIRPDGRNYTTIRPLSAEVAVVPRVHGTGLFQRGETQVLTIATLGTPRDAKTLDGLNPEDIQRFLHHYNFPPFSTGETGMLRGPKRREIGHGALAETALRPMIPPEDEFPYTLRLVSEVMSSNGSTSMGSVCASTLALMDAGVPIKSPVAGIAMGLIKEGDRVAVLTDEIMAQALAQAREARLQILEVMRSAIAEPRPELNEFAPRMETIKISVEKIGAVIGPGGKTVRAIQEATGVTIDIQPDGTVYVAGSDGPSVLLAMEKIRGLTEEPELGRIYTGKVTRVEPYGAFVEFLPGQDGMVHISQLADYRVDSVESEVSVGDEVMVMVIDVDGEGKVRLSRQAVLEGWTVDEAREKDRGSRGGRSGGGSRGGRDRRGGGGNRGGGDRRGGGDHGRR